MIDYFKKFKNIDSNPELTNKAFQDIDNNKIKLNNDIDTLTNKEKEAILYQIKGTIKNINPDNIPFITLKKTISAYLFTLQLDLQIGYIDPITFLIRRGVLWELFEYHYKYKIQILKLGVQLNNLKQEVRKC